MKIPAPVSVTLLAATLAACSAEAPSLSGEPQPAPTDFVATNGDEWTAAIESGDIEALGALVDAQGPLAVIDDRTALQIAADAANADAVALLVERGADMRATDKRERAAWTAMHFAANSDCGACIEALLAAGDNPTRKDRGQPGRAPIHIAASVGSLNALRALLDGGVEVDLLDGGAGHALMWAAYYGQTDAAQLLLEYGSDPTLVDGTRMNASERAAGEGHDELAALLAEAIVAWEQAS